MDAALLDKPLTPGMKLEVPFHLIIAAGDARDDAQVVAEEAFPFVGELLEQTTKYAELYNLDFDPSFTYDVVEIPDPSIEAYFGPNFPKARQLTVRIVATVNSNPQPIVVMQATMTPQMVVAVLVAAAALFGAVGWSIGQVTELTNSAGGAGLLVLGILIALIVLRRS